MMRWFHWAAAIALACGLPVAGSAQMVIEITPVRDGLHLLTAGSESTAFLVTSEGIILGDPLDRVAALDIRRELERRFPGKPVRVVVQSHHHPDRSEGANVFNETAELVGHDRFNASASAARQEDPSAYIRVGTVERTISGLTHLTLGDGSVDATPAGGWHAPDMVVLSFPRQRVAFVVDGPLLEPDDVDLRLVPVGALGAWLRTVAALDVDTVLFDDGRSAPRAQIEAFSAYVNGLIEVAASTKDARSSLAHVGAGALPAALVNGPYAANRARDLPYVYSRVFPVRVDVHLSALALHSSADDDYCSSALYTTCEPASGTRPGGLAGLGMRMGPVGFVYEWRAGAQFTGRLGNALYEESFAYRSTRSSYLFRVTLPEFSNVTVRLLAGPSHLRYRILGQDLVKQAIAPFGGRHPIEAEGGKTSIAIGLDLVARAGARWNLVIPVRLGQNDDVLRAPASPDLQVGAGLSFDVKRGIAIR